MKISHTIASLVMTATIIQHAAANSDIVISKAWVRESPDWVTILASYANVKNTSEKTRTLIEVSSPAFEKIELHSMTLEKGMMEMEKQSQFVIQPGSSLIFEPGGNHFMCYNPKTTLPKGKEIELLFHFANGETVAAQAKVKNPRKQN